MTRAQADLASRPGFLARLIDCVADAIVVLDADMQLCFANVATRSIMTGSADGDLTSSVLDYVHPDDLDAVAAAFAELLEDPGGRASTTLRVRAARGDLPVEATATNLIDEPTVAGVVVCFRDRSGEVAFREQAEVLMSAVEAATDVIVILDPRGAILHANPAAVRLCGGCEPTHIDDLEPASARMLLRDVGLPMARRTGWWMGETSLAAAGGEPPLEVSVVVSAIRDERGNVRALSLIARDMTEHKLIEAALRQQARLDPLTGLLNRGGLMDELNQMVARCRDDGRNDGRADGRGAGVGVLFIDLDHFKIANDSIGHANGDQLLRQVAQRLDAATYPGALARYGGDEFVALLPQVRDATALAGTAERLCASLAEPFTVAGNTVHLSCSVGVAVADRTTAPDDALRAADLAMYRAKERGRNRYELFDRSLHDAANQRMLLQSQLRQAVPAHQLAVQYQPIVDLGTAKVLGFEALVRWNHPDGCLLLPDEFLEAARHAQLMAAIDDWVLDQACEQLGAWRRTHPGARGLTMAVNLSSEQLARHDLPAVVASHLASRGLDPGQLVLEITERQLLDDIDDTTDRVEALRALGVGIGLDDFGTDRAPLSHLSRLRIDLLKLDRSFLSHADARAGASVVRAVASLARELGIACVAVGVENALQVDLVQAAGVPRAQGFWFSPALDAADAEAVLVRSLAVRP